MGAVYLARERTLDRLVALKVLPPELALGVRTERFRREARIAAKLTHPNIVSLHTFGEFEGMVYLVMGYVRGESLGDRMRREGKLPPEEARRILAELADALDYAHRQGVVHRDIKPDNILLDDESGRPMLTDFGIAKFRAAGETVTNTGIAMGTPHYISPEQAGGERDVDGRSDLYSLGVVGYVMLSGRLPFEGESHQEIIGKHMLQDPPPLASITPRVPAELSVAVLRCLQKLPKDRWPDGRTFREAITGETTRDDFVGEEYETAKGQGLWAVLFAVGCWLGAWAAYLNGFVLKGTTIPWWILLLGVGFAFVTAILGASRRLETRALPGARILFWPPDGLTAFWVPRAIRRPGDIWDRLPRVVRRARAASSLSLVFVSLAFAAIFLYVGSPAAGRLAESWPGFSRSLRLGLLGLIVSGVLGLTPAIMAWRLCRRHGLGVKDVAKVLNDPTRGSSFWKKPAIAAFLLPETSARDHSSTREPGTPQEYLTAIADAAEQLTGPVREIGSQALAGARQLLSVVQRIDREIETLGRDADPAEIQRFEQKLAALGDQPSSEPDSRRQMRQLVHGQLDLMRRLAGQLEAATARRAQLLGLLRTLWLQLANLRAATAADALDTHEVTAPIRALCQEIERHAAAVEETERVLAR